MILKTKTYYYEDKPTVHSDNINQTQDKSNPSRRKSKSRDHDETRLKNFLIK